jgi:DNA adenine methylase
MIRYKTPLRYPGGKQKLAPFIAEVLTENNLVGCQYVEPYAGGAGVAIELLLEKIVSHIHLNDSFYPIFAFWNSVVNRSEEFCRKISLASLTINEWKKKREILRNYAEHDELEVGFSMFYLNRCNRSGVLSGGVIGGLEQTGKWKMDARFPRNELIRRIEAIALRKNSISLTNMDAEGFLLNNVPKFPQNTFIYCDPPYFEKSNRLYMNSYSPEDHVRVAKVIQEKVHKKWIVSYDGVIEILTYYSKRKAFLYDLQYNASRVYKGKEVFIFSDSLSIPSESVISEIDEAIPESGRCYKLKSNFVKEMHPPQIRSANTIP